MTAPNIASAGFDVLRIKLSPYIIDATYRFGYKMFIFYVLTQTNPISV